MKNYLKLLIDLTISGFPFSFWIGWIKKIRYRRLYREFNFDRWHILPLNHRLYALKIIRYINKRVKKDHVIVEVGCGLGEILMGIKGGVKIGYDIDRNVIRAAQHITRNRNDIHLQAGSFADINSPGKIDFLITVNFIHAIAPEILKTYYSQLCGKWEVRTIIADEVKGKDYKYTHRIVDLIPDYFTLDCAFKVNELRRIVIYKHI